MANQVISRAEAKAKGLSRYYTGKLCKNLHIAERRTINGICVDCDAEIEKRYNKKNADKLRNKWRAASKRARKKNPDRIRKNNKKWETANPDKVKQRIERWRSANPERRNAHEKKWRDANPEKIKRKNIRYKKEHAERLSPIAIKRTKQWRENNPEKVLVNARKYRQTRRAREYNAIGSYTNEQIAGLLEKQNWKCAAAHCGASLRDAKELDHIIALSRGGSNDIANLQWLCVPCNRSKQDKDPIEWAQEHGHLL